MQTKRLLIAILAIGATIAVGLLAYRLEAPRRPGTCQVCGRMIPEQTAFRIDTASGSVHACCPACAMHFMMHHPDSKEKAWATDFNSGRMIPASSAYYDQGGDVQYCTRHASSVERGTEVVSQRVYDRCLPTLVAFSSRAEADAYRQQHGGRVVTYDEAVRNLALE
ncbi:MAG: hypothetical protein ACM3NO_09485 [Deltaproteobacteria bacterium]